MIDSAGIGLLLRIKAKNEASGEIKQFRDDVKKATNDIEEAGQNSLTDFAGNLGLTAEQAAMVGKAMPIAGAAVAALATAAVAAGAAVVGIGIGLFKLAQNAGEASVEIDKFQKLTSLSVTSIQALKLAAESTGESLEQIEEVWESFSELIIEAAQGEEDAVKKLTLSNIQAKTAINDLDGTFKKALKTVADAPAGFQQNAVAMRLFGESGISIIPIIQSFGGNLDELIKKLKESGTIMDADGIKKAKAFSREYGALSAQVSGLANNFAVEFMPEITSALKSVGKFLAANKEDFMVWGAIIGDLLKSIPDLMKYAGDAMRLTLETVNSSLSAMTGGLLNLLPLIDALMPSLTKIATTSYEDYRESYRQKVKDRQRLSAAEEAARKNAPKGKVKLDTEDADKKAEEEREKRLDVLLRGIDLDIDLARTKYENDKEDLDNLLAAQAITIDEYREKLEKILTDTEGKINAFLVQKQAKLAERFKGGELANALKEIEKQQLESSQKFDNDAEKIALDTRNRKIKAKETEVKTLVDLDKAAADIVLAENELVFANKKKSEEEYLQLKEATTVVLLEKERKHLDAALASIAAILTAEAIARKINAEQLIKENEVYQELYQRRILISSNIEKTKTENTAAETKRRLALVTQIEAEKTEVEKTRADYDAEVERQKSETAIRSGKNKLAALKGLFDFEKTLLEQTKNFELEKLDAEKEKRLESIKGFKDEILLREQIEELYRQRKLISEAEFQKKLREIENNLNPQIDQAEADEKGGSLFGGVMKGLGFSIKEMLEPVDALKGIGETLASTFNQVADAVGASVRAFVLFGSAGGSFRKFAAEVIASVAQMAVVSALWELAQGLAMSALFWFTGNAKYAKSAADHYTAAVTYGLVGGVAMAAGRAVAGNSFKGNNATNSQNNSTFGSENRSSNGGDVYSSNRDKQIVNMSRNASASIPEQRVVIESKGGLAFDELFVIRYTSGGKIRDTIRRDD